MTDSVVSFLINQLSTILNEESTLLGGFQDDLVFIKDELASMRAFLRYAEGKEDNTFELQEWIKQVREVAYDVEDVLDDFVFYFSRDRGSGFYGGVRRIYSSIKNLGARHRIASEIRSIRARVESISTRQKRYRPIYAAQETGAGFSGPKTNDASGYVIRANSLLIEEAKLVGIEDPKRELISHILNDNPRLKVISVLGMGGLGKTTLVKKVYTDVSMKKHFKCHAWLMVSQNFNFMGSTKDLIRQLYDEIGSLVPTQVESMDDIRLREFVKEFLKDRKYILVLDDVWCIQSWEAIRCMLPDSNIGSRIILTTRNSHVASASCLEQHVHVHRMEPLSETESWTLFCNRIFQNSQCPPYLEDVSRRILRKCEGLPLAISAISGVLSLKSKDNVGEWEMILQNLGGELQEGTGQLDRIKRILLLSYNDLPHDLKSCLLYLSIYPENYIIYMGDLCEKWIAQGFVRENGGASSTDVGRGYAKELINRSLIQVAYVFADGTLEYFRIHDFLRDMIVSKSEELNFTTIAKGNYSTRTRSDKVRRLAIHDFVEYPEPAPDLNHSFESLRSLEIFRYNSPLSVQVLSQLLCGRSKCGGSKLVKVLDLRNAGIEEIPKEVFRLFHLRYLCLHGTRVRVVPKSIEKLQNLEYLDLSGTEVRELPAEILKLKKLRVILLVRIGNYFEHYAVSGFKSPSGIGKLLSLEFISAIRADSEEIVREIGKLTKLMKLVITKIRREDGKVFLLSLSKLTNLREMYVSSIREDETLDLQHTVPQTPRFLKTLMLVGRLEGVPQWVLSLHGLTFLCLKHSGLREDDDELRGIVSLQDLPNLMSLVLRYAYEGETLCFKKGGFRKLERLELSKLKRFKFLKFEEDSMPSLQRLIMACCKQVEELPWGLENLKMLKSIELYEMPDELIKKVQSLDKESELYKTIAHKPEVCFADWMNGGWTGYFF